MSTSPAPTPTPIEGGKRPIEEQGMLSQVVDSVFTPGTNAGVIKAMTYSFYSLFATLSTLLWLTGGNLHVGALLVLSVGLFLSIKWFLVRIQEVEEEQRIKRLKEEAGQSTVGEAKKDR